MKRMACVLMLATGTGIALGASAPSALADPTSATISNGLKVNIVSPGAVTNDGPINLDVNFRGGSVRSVELLVDGNRVFKKSVKLRDTHGSLSFRVDSSLLPEGDHDVTIVAYDPSGNTATSTMRLHVTSIELNDVAHFTYPKRNANVQNVVPIEIKIDANIKNPYVAFLMDNDFLSVRNYPPYTYNWDSAKVADGAHTVTIEIYDADTQALLKKLSIPIVVKNVGGLTNRQNTTPALKPGSTGITSVDIVGAGISTSKSELQDDSAGLSRSAAGNSSFTLRSQPPSFVSSFAPTPGDLVPDVPGVERNGATRPGPDAIGSTAMPALPRGTTVRPFTNTAADLITDPSEMQALTLDSGKLSRLQLRPRRAGNVAARPHTTLGVDDSVQPIHSAPIAQPVRHMPVVQTRFRRNPVTKTFDVAFDNSRIAFDVAPRVEHGMPLAPFRAIFEHSGGSVTWYGASKTVRAVNSTREVEFKIGEKSAKVNNHALSMDSKPYVERGRAIVPLSFVRDAMNVKVTYDAKNGHLLIESKK